MLEQSEPEACRYQSRHHRTNFPLNPRQSLAWISRGVNRINRDQLTRCPASPHLNTTTPSSLYLLQLSPPPLLNKSLHANLKNGKFPVRIMCQRSSSPALLLLFFVKSTFLWRSQPKGRSQTSVISTRSAKSDLWCLEGECSGAE